MSTICNTSVAAQLPSSSFMLTADIKCKLQAVNVKSCDDMGKPPCSCLLIILQAFYLSSQPASLKKVSSLRADISVEREKCQRYVLKNCCRKRSIRQHFNTAQDHHRWLYQKALLANLIGTEMLKLFESTSSFSCLYENLRRDGYFKCCVHLCKKSVCCELTVLKELLSKYVENSGFLPLMKRQMSHFSHYIRLKDPQIQSEVIALIGPNPQNSPNMLTHVSISALESTSGQQTNFLADEPSKFAVGKGLFVQISNEEEEESDSACCQFWSNHFESDFNEIQRQIQIKNKDKYTFIILTSDKMYEEMLEQHYEEMKKGLISL